jgi:hypothetical protein
MAVVAVRYSDDPILWQRIGGLSAEVWPEYNRHGDVLNVYWNRLYEVFPDYQFVLYDQESDEVLAEGHTVPTTWDGTVEGLGPGIDASIAGFELRARGGAPSALCALAAEIPPRNRGRRLAGLILGHMAATARRAGLEWLIAPVRPNWKERYPLTPIERYARWVRGDGRPFDPWLRVHTQMGGTITAPLPESMRITGTVVEWEAWTGMAFPDSGEFVFPDGLATVTIDRASGIGTYWEPNVWVVHAVGPTDHGRPPKSSSGSTGHSPSTHS